jgi:hypothetical protein
MTAAILYPLGDDFRRGEIGGLLEGFVFEPEDVEVYFVAFEEFVEVEDLKQSVSTRWCGWLVERRARLLNQSFGQGQRGCSWNDNPSVWIENRDIDPPGSAQREKRSIVGGQQFQPSHVRRRRNPNIIMIVLNAKTRGPSV